MDYGVVSVMNKALPVVAVLMSTYNGEKYIREQLDSIFAQRGVDVRLYVRDDGSTDDTLNIVNTYAAAHTVEVLQDGENVGPGESFMRLVYRYAHTPDIEYYAFADQDDVWLEDKLLVAVEAIRAAGFEGPVLYGSNQLLYVDGENRGDRHRERQSVELIPHLTINTIAGCTFVFNKALACLVTDADRPDPRIIKYRIHDAWMMLVAIACGHAIYDETSHMLYRIHSGNAVGVKGLSLGKRLGRLQRLFVHRDDANLRMITAQQLLALFEDLDDETRRVLGLYANYQNSFADKIRLIRSREIIANCSENPAVFAVKVLINYI